MNPKLALAMVLVLLGPAFSGCTDGGQETPSETMDRLIAQADKCTSQLNSNTQGKQSSGDDSTILGDLDYATAEDRTLLRWTGPKGHPNGTYEITRRPAGSSGSYSTTVKPVTGVAKARSILDNTDTRWPDLSSTVVEAVNATTPGNVTDLAGALPKLHQDPRLAEVLAQRYYPVAVVAGNAYLDTRGQDGTTYEYQVAARTGSGTTTLDSVTVTTGRTTPLPPPRNPACVTLDTDALTGNGTWGELQQRQRILHLKVLLSWQHPDMVPEAPEAIDGYDIYRAPVPEEAPKGISSLADLDFSRINEEPIQPVGPQNGSSASPSTATEDLNFFHADTTPEPGRYVYRVAPRDLLGHPRDPVDDAGQLSDAVVATSHDFDPPERPNNFTATPAKNNSAVRVNWSHPNLTWNPVGDLSTQSSHLAPPGGSIEAPVQDPVPDLPEGSWSIDGDSDLSHFVVYRTTNATALPPSPSCTDESRCWVPIRNTTRGVIYDNETLRDTARWYRVRAVDESEAGNPSAWAGPDHATLHDQTPPPRPHLDVNATFRDPDMGDPERPQDQPEIAEGVHGPTLTIGRASGDDETTRARLYCQFEGNDTWTRIATVPMEDVSAENVHLADHYDPPTEVEAECRARAVDEHGNVGDPSAHTNVTFGGRDGSQALPQPVLISARFGTHDPGLAFSAQASQTRRESTRTDTTADRKAFGTPKGPDLRGSTPSSGVEGIRLNWSMPEIQNLRRIEVVRRDPAGDNVTTWTVDASTRTGVDTDVRPGRVYEYKIRAIPWDQENDPVESLPVESGVAQGPDYADIRRPKRPLGNIDLSVASLPGKDAVNLTWRARDDDAGNRRFAVFRSLHQNEGYIQQTPIRTFTGGVPNRDVQQEVWRGVFTDENVHRNHWYVVVEFDHRTGEPIRASDPVEATNMGQPAPAPNWGQVPLASGITVPQRSCSGSVPSEGEIIGFAEGFELEIDDLQVVGGTASGTGTTTITTPKGPRTLTVSFSDVLVETTPPGEPRGACQGQAQRDLSGMRYPTDGFATRLHDLVIGPRGTQAVLDTEVRLPDSVSYNDGHRYRRWVPLDNVSVHADETVTFNATVQGDCQDPSFGFQLETAPIQVVPTGRMTVSQDALTFQDACTERNTTRWTTQGLRPMLVGGRNDGYLRPTLHSTGSVTIDGSGLQGRFKNATLGSGGVHWTPSAPARFGVEVTGSITVDFQDSRVGGGSLSKGTLSFTHLQEATGYDTSRLYEPSFNQLSLEPDGRAYGEVSLSRKVAWNSLWTNPSKWEALLGAVTFDGNPGRSIVASHPGRTKSLTALGDAHLEPGLNIRTSSQALHSTCSSGSRYDTAMDAHLRYGGMNHAFRALLAGPKSIDIHGYQGSVSKWGRAFLDNQRVAEEMAGSLTIPSPSDVTFQLDPMKLDADGCIKGGTGLGDKELSYWNLTTGVDALEFRTPPEGVPHDGDALLFAQGTYEVPHLDPDRSGRLPAEYAFLPGGDVNRSRFLLDQARHEVDGYAFLLEGFRLSEVNEDPGWVRKANIQDPPTHDPTKEGFLELQGRLMTPYFGALTSSSGDPPKLRFTADDHYLGFDRRPRVEKTWVDLDKAELVWAYDLVYAQDPQKDEGRFTAFQSYEFLPLGVLFHALEKPKRVVQDGFDHVDRRIDTAVAHAQRKAAIPFQQVRGEMGVVRSEVLQGLDRANATLSSYVDRYFAMVRQEIRNAGPNGVTASELQRNITKGAFRWFASAIQPVQKGLHTLQDFRENELQSALQALAKAQAIIQRLQEASVDTQRMLRQVTDYLSRAKELLDAHKSKLPQNLAGTKLNPKALASDLSSALTQAQNLQRTFSKALGNVEPALDSLSQGIEALETTLEEVDAALADAIEIGNRALSGLQDARDTLASLVPQATGDLTSSLKATLLQETHRLQSAVKTPLHSVHGRVRSQFTTVFDGLWAEFNRTVGNVQQQVNAAIAALGTDVKGALDNLETTVVRTIDKVVAAIENALDKLRLVYLDASPVIGPQKLGSFLGLASGVAAIKGTAETRGTKWSQLPKADKDRWRERIGWDETRKPYSDVYGNASSNFGATRNGQKIRDHHTDSVAAVGKWVSDPDEAPPENKAVGGGTGGLLKDWGVGISEARGSVTTAKVGQDDYQMEELALEVRTRIGKGQDPAFKAEVIHFSIDRHGEYYVYGRDIETSLVKKDLTADVDLLINTSEPRFEGGLTVYKLQLEQVYVAEAGAAVGVGETILYVGVKFDGIIQSGGGKIGVGGVVLAGRVDAKSPVLEQHFPDAIKRVKAIPATPSSGSEYVGMYLSAHMDVPLSTLTGVNLGCVLSLNVGGRLGFWYFQSPTATPPPLTFGMKIGGYAYGKVICAISARGEITITFTATGTIPAGEKPDLDLKLKGVLWVAGGIGDCSPGTWKGWGDRWWDDSWCAQAGARAEIVGTGPIPFDASKMKVRPSVSADAEGPF